MLLCRCDRERSNSGSGELRTVNGLKRFWDTSCALPKYPLVLVCEAARSNVRVRMRSIFVYMHKHTCGLLYCSVGRKGHGPGFTSDKPPVLSMERTLVPPVSDPNTSLTALTPQRVRRRPCQLWPSCRRDKSLKSGIVSSFSCCSR